MKSIFDVKLLAPDLEVNAHLNSMVNERLEALQYDYDDDIQDVGDFLWFVLTIDRKRNLFSLLVMLSQ